MCNVVQAGPPSGPPGSSNLYRSPPSRRHSKSNHLERCCYYVHTFRHLHCLNRLSKSKARSPNCEKRLLVLSCLFACPSVRPHGTTPLPLDGFSWILIQNFSKIYRENQIFIKNLTRITVILPEE